MMLARGAGSPRPAAGSALLRVLFFASAGLNLALALWIAAEHRRMHLTADHAGAPVVGDAGHPSGAEAISPRSSLDDKDPDATREMANLAAKLRGLGFSPSVIHAVLLAQIRDRYAVEREALFRANQVPFWRRQSVSAPLRDRLRQLEITRDQALASVEAEVGAVPEEERLERLAAYGSIDPAKFASLRRMERDYQQMLQQDSRRAKSSEELRAAVALLEANRAKDLAALLTPAEYEEYRQRNSESAHRLSDALAEVDVSDSEYHALFALEEAYDAKSRPLGQANPLQNHEEALADYMDQGRELLGDDRFKRVLAAHDAAFRSQLEFVAATPGLKSGTEFDLFALERAMRAKYIGMQQMPESQRAQETTAAAAEINRRLTEILGQNGPSNFDRGVNAGVLKLLLVRAARQSGSPASH